ncbi:hypothetical protein MPTK2_3g20085 [Marchantia polymorpha subsp. ruderalis]
MFSLSGSVEKNGNETYVFTGSKTTIKWLTKIFAAANDNLKTPLAQFKVSAKRKAAAGSRVSKSSQESSRKAWDYGPKSRPKTTPGTKASRATIPITSFKSSGGSAGLATATLSGLERPRASSSASSASVASSQLQASCAKSPTKRPQSTTTIKIRGPKSGERQIQTPASTSTSTSTSTSAAAAAVDSVLESSVQSILPTRKIAHFSSKLTWTKSPGLALPSGSPNSRLALEQLRPKQREEPVAPPSQRREAISRSIDTCKPFLRAKSGKTLSERTNTSIANDAVTRALQNASKPSAEPKIFSYLRPPPEGAKYSHNLTFKNPLLKKYHEGKVTAALRCLSHPEIITADTFRVLSAPFQRFLVQTHPEMSYLSHQQQQQQQQQDIMES